MKKQQRNTVAIYCRLSRDDGSDSESNSIITQRQMLNRHAKEQGFTVYDEYIDDGISGTTFHRPAFQRMVQDIDRGNIGIVLCKDLSRLGRNNAMVAHYTEIYFPDNDVRFIALTDGIDTAKGENEIMPFKSVVNEFYAKDISKKVRSAYRTKALNGEFTASRAPYGYKKNPENKHQLVIDENTADTVRRIFQMAADGYTPYKISVVLSKDGILTPRAYTASQCGAYRNNFNRKYPADWCNVTIMSMLQNREYLGHLVCNKSTTKSFKNRKQVGLPKEEWIETKNTHEPIVDDYLFELAQKVVRVRKPKNSTGHVNIFAGLLKCSDCGGGLCFIKPKNEGHEGSYNCNLYRKKTTKYCTAHYITHKALYQLVLDDIRRIAQIAKQNESDLSEYALQLSESNTDGKTERFKKELDKQKRRKDEIHTIMKKLLEQNASGAVSDEWFLTMSAEYETERKELSGKIADLQLQLDEQETTGSNTVKFLETVRKYSEITELNSIILNDLIDSIVIYNAEGKSRKNRKQRVEINYKFIGLIQTAEEMLE